MKTNLDGVGLGHAPTIRTFTTASELEALLELASGVPHHSHVVEVGSYIGASTCFLAAGALPRSCSLLCIDTWNNETMPEGPVDTYAEFQRNLLPVWDRIATLRTRTEHLTPDDLPMAISLAFIDGDHSFQAAQRDFSLVAPRIQAEGVVAFHDTLFYQGVSRVLGEALATGLWRLEGCCNNLSWIRRTEFASADSSTR